MSESLPMDFVVHLISSGHCDHIILHLLSIACRQFQGYFVWNSVVHFSDASREQSYEYGGTFEPWNGPKVTAAKLKKSRARLSRISITSTDESNMELLSCVSHQLKSIKTRSCDTDALAPIFKKIDFSKLKEIDIEGYGFDKIAALITFSSGVPNLHRLRFVSWTSEPLYGLLDFLSTHSGSLEYLEVPNADDTEIWRKKLAATTKANKSTLRIVSVPPEVSLCGLFSTEILDSKNFIAFNDSCLDNYGLPISAFRFNGATFIESYLKFSDSNLDKEELDSLFDLSLRPSTPSAQSAEVLVGLIPSPGSCTVPDSFNTWILAKIEELVTFICSAEHRDVALESTALDAVLACVAFYSENLEGFKPNPLDILKNWISRNSKILAATFGNRRTFPVGMMTAAQLLHDTEWMVSVDLDPNLMDDDYNAPFYFSLLHRPFLLQQLLALPGANPIVHDDKEKSLFQRVLESNPPKNENECHDLHEIIELSFQHAPTPSVTAERILRSYQTASDEQKHKLLDTFSSPSAVSVLFSNPALLAAFAKISHPDWKRYVTPTVLEYVLEDSQALVNRVKVLRYFIFLHQKNHTGEKSLRVETATAVAELLWDFLLERGLENSETADQVTKTFPVPEKIQKLLKEAAEARHGEYQ